MMAFERRWTQVALEAIFPGGANQIDAGAALEDVFRTVPARVALGLRAAVWLLALAPIVVLFRPRTLASLDVKTRERVVLTLLSSPMYLVRQLALLLKAFGALMFVAAPGVRASIVKPLVQLRKEERHVA